MINDSVSYTMLYTNVYNSNALDIVNSLLTYSIDYTNVYSWNAIDMISNYLSMTYTNIYESNFVDMVSEYIGYVMTYTTAYNSNEIDMVSNLSMTYTNIYSGLVSEKVEEWWGRKSVGNTKAQITIIFKDKPNEETTITLTDYEGTSVVFEVDNASGVGDGASVAGATPMDPPSNDADGMKTIMASSVNDSVLKITATVSPVEGKVTLEQDAVGTIGNTTITYSDYSNWDYNTEGTLETTFSGGTDKWVYTQGEGAPRRFDNTSLTKLFAFGMAYSDIYNTNKLAFNDYLTFSSNYTTPYTMNLITDYNDHFTLDSNWTIPMELHLSGSWPFTSLGAEWVTQIEDTILDISDSHGNLVNLKDEISPLKSWGTGVNNTWIMNMANPGNNDDYNTGYHNDKQLYYTVAADMEYVSESSYRVSCSNYAGNQGTYYTECSTDDHCEATDYKCYYNRLVLDDSTYTGTEYTYKSYFGSSSINPEDGAPVTGRPVGRTTFIMTGSDGSITYPSNHWRNWSTVKDQLIHLFYVKKPTTIETLDENNNVISDASYNSGQFLHNRDLFPDKSFYSITVEGSDAENVLKVDRPDNRPGKGK